MAEANLIKKADLIRAREIEFTMMFSENVKKLMEALGVTRKIVKQAGTVLKSYRAVGTLEDGDVGEGETIPLSKYITEEVSYGEIQLKKWSKSTSAEAIMDKGYDQAVGMTTDKMLQDAQRIVRSEFFSFLATGTGTASGDNLQAALAQSWGKLQVLFEDDEITQVHFMNPMDVADYLATAQVTTQTAFGMAYIENFLGLGTVFMNSSVPKGRVYSTAKNNLILYYLPVNGADLGEVFQFTSDETGLIAIHEQPDYSNMTAKDTVALGVKLMAERLDGVVVATIGAGA